MLPKKLALPIFCSDALSSVAYATEAILVALSAGGLGFYHLAPLLSVAVAVLFVLVAALPADLLRLPQRWGLLRRQPPEPGPRSRVDHRVGVASGLRADRGGVGGGRDVGDHLRGASAWSWC